MELKIVKGQISLFKEIFFVKNDKSYLGIDISLLQSIIILGFIGILRTVFEVLLGIHIHPKWYVLDFDVILTMFFFVIHFCFFGAFLIHWSAIIFNKRIPYRTIFNLLFCLQSLHLIIPFFDWIGLKLKIPWLFHLIKINGNQYFFSPLIMTLGIIIVWIISISVILRFLINKLGIGWGGLIGLSTFTILYFPIYHLWPSFIIMFNLITNYSFGMKNVMGYGVYFMLVSIIGIIYYYAISKKWLKD